MTKFRIKIKPQTIVITLSVLITVSLTYFVAMPQATKLAVRTAELTTKKEQARQLEERRNSLLKLTDKLPGYAADIERLALAYPQEEQTVEALIQAQAIIERSGLTIDSLAPSKTNIGALQVSMVLKGSYESLINLLRELDSNLRPVIINNLSVQAGASDKEVGVLTVNISAGFEYNNPAPIGVEAAAGGNPSAGGEVAPDSANPVIPAKPKPSPKP